MKKTLFLTVVILLHTLPLFAKGGGGCGHGCGHGGHGGVYYGGHSSHDTANMYMNGVGWMDDGQVLIGKFLQRAMAPGICIFYPYSYPICHGNIHVKAVRKFVFAGADTTLSYRKDSTEYCHIDNHKFMVRKLTCGKLEVYDDSYIAPLYQGQVDDITVKYYGLIIHVGSVKQLDRMIRTIIPGYEENHPFNKKKQVNVIAIFKAINDFNNQS